MKFIIVGLGSMGNRRARCLKALGCPAGDIRGVDLREDRRSAAHDKHGIAVFTALDEAQKGFGADGVIVSLPPDRHVEAMKWCVRNNLHVFVEASVIQDGLEELDGLFRGRRLVCSPSCTLRFHPAIKLIDQVVKSGRLGKLSNFTFHCGQYLPDWHTYEKVSDYYVSNPATGGAREIVPFELTWIVNTFGFPTRIAGNYRKTIHIEGAEQIDDTYNCLLDYGDHLGVMTVDVVSRCAVRKLLVNGSEGQLQWSWEADEVRIYDPQRGRWETVAYPLEKAHEGYNPKITEGMYIEEVRQFTSAISGHGAFPNTLEDDIRVLSLLAKIELSNREGRFVDV